MKRVPLARRLVLAFTFVFLAAAFLNANGAYAQGAPAQAPAAAEQKPAEAKPKTVGSDLGLPAKLGQEIAKAPEGKGKGQDRKSVV